MTVVAGAGSNRTRRPKDRKEQIARVSAEAFSKFGYHAVSMEDIAARVGVSAASLYRHYSGKYELFREAVLTLGLELVAATDFLDETVADPGAAWDRAVRALIDAAIKNRASGGLYRWEARYLDEADQLALNAQIKLVNRRLQRPLLALRPALTSRDRWKLSAAVLSVIGSVTDHRARLGGKDIRATLGAIAAALRDTELPVAGDLSQAAPILGAVGSAAGEYESILREAMLLFNDNGYAETAMEDIAVAAGISTSGIYRFFSGKAAILAAAYHRAADRVSGDVSTILATTSDPGQAVDRLIDAYVRRSFDHPELASVYYADRRNVPVEDQVVLHNIQCSTVEAWVRQVVATRPALDAVQARFAVHAAFALVVDLGRLVHYDRTEESQALVRHLMRVTLLETQPV
jgi:AcrR family transcriptional regulator